PVKEAEEKEFLRRGQVYLVPGDYHLLIERDGSVSLDISEKVHFSRPSIDVTLESAAEIYGEKLAVILLSGASPDGAEGLRQVKESGGLCMVQHPGSAEMSVMPKLAIERAEV